MTPSFTAHLLRNWPLALIVAGLLGSLPIALLTGVFHTNQGRIRRGAEPGRYWKWLCGFGLLALCCGAVLLGSYRLAQP
jgi:hypothetical protein